MSNSISTLETDVTRTANVEVNSRPQLIPTQELIAMAQADFTQQINNGKLSSDQVTDFVSDRVTGVRVNGVNVLSIDFDHTDWSIDKVAKAYMESGRTKVVVPEYFYPELEANAARIGLLSRMEHATGSNRVRLGYAKDLAVFCKEINKPIAVIDIASKARYMVDRELLPVSPTILGIIEIFAATTSPKPDLLPGLLLMSSGVAWYTKNVHDMLFNKSIFDPDKIGSLEKFILDFEQARRLYAARGIEQLTQEYQPSAQNDQSQPQIVIMYPKIHGIRIADNLINPHHGLDKAKDIVYRTFGHGLDFSVRQWAWKDTLHRLTSSRYHWGKATLPQPNIDTNTSTSSSPHWSLVSERKIAA